MKPARILSVLTVAGLAAAVTTSGISAGAANPQYHSATWKGCASSIQLCTEVDDPLSAFGHYVGHDEPSVLFYSNEPGSGNHMTYNVTLPTEPSGAFDNTKGYSLETSPALWFGMAMCDTQSYPEQSQQCTPDTDSNIVVPGTTKSAPGVAFMELQFYPPGFASQFAAFSCHSTDWCAAMTIDSLSEDPFNGLLLNQSCINQIGGNPEYVNFAYLTKSGKPIGPPNPLQFQFIGSGDPRSSSDTFFMKQGDKLTVNLHDSANGLVATVTDHTQGTVGSMTASAANHFGQIKFQPSGHSCQEIDYTFHPMFSTSSPLTRVLWAAHTYNIAMDAETGHFDFCSSIDANTASCNGIEGIPGETEPAEGLSSNSDDFGCFSDTQNLNPAYFPPPGQSTGYCLIANDPGFDGTTDHEAYWPNSLTPGTQRETPFLFTSPLTGNNDSEAYPSTALETDLPRIEAADLGGACNRTTGVGCVNPPVTDDGQPAPFYTYFSFLKSGNRCMWAAGDLGQAPAGHASSSQQFGPELFSPYWKFGGHGATVTRTNNFNSGPFNTPSSC